MKTLVLTIWSLVMLSASPAHGQPGIVDNRESPHAALRSIGMGECRWTTGFWADKFKLCEEVMVPHMGTLLKGETGHAYSNFKIAAGLEEGHHQGSHWQDGDFYKWMESAVHVYAVNRDERIVDELNEIIEVIGKAQQDNGYLSTQITTRGIQPFSARYYHELYNSGHLLTCACIHHRVTGKRNFLDIAVRHADHIYDTFQGEPEELARFGFNQTQIMGLVELYRTTGNTNYLRLAELFINMRGRSRVEPHPTVRFRSMGDMVQERKPLRKSDEAVGHAVLAMYFYAGAADVYAETGERALINALDRLWENVVHRKMYLTGGVGQTHHGASSNVDFVHEAFIDEYMMPNATAYNETCANLANAMFSYRMLGIKGESRYADIMEQVLFNSALSGISADGKHYFYTNPLRRTYDQKLSKTDYPTRVPYIPCFCCPPNLVRTIAKLSGWAYSLSDNGIAVNLYGGNALATRLMDGSPLELIQETQYPWDGAVTLTMRSCREEPFEVLLRIPAWAEGATVRVNGRAPDIEARAGAYATITRPWKAGDRIELELPMAARLVAGHPRIEEIRNQAAIQRGPVVYCIETPDLPDGTGILDVHLPADVELTPRSRPDFLGGMTTLSGEVLLHAGRTDAMYSPLEQPDWKRVDTTFIPYYAWSNRGRSEMTVWMPVVWK